LHSFHGGAGEFTRILLALTGDAFQPLFMALPETFMKVALKVAQNRTF